MFEGVQIAIGIAAAIAAFFLGIGLIVGGWIGKAKRTVWLGAGFMSVAVVVTVLVWIFIQQVDRDDRWDSPEVQRLRWIEHADVVADFRKHIEQEHDFRLLSQYGLSFGTEFPGLADTPEFQQLVQEYGSRRLESGSDVFSSTEEMRLQEEITHYAIRYNAILVGYLEHEK